MDVDDSKNVIARQWRGEWRLIALFQFSGIFFIFFYYPEILFSIHDRMMPVYTLRESVNTFLLWAYARANTLQLLLSDQYHILILTSLIAICAVLALIFGTTIRRMDFGVLLRAVFFLAVGLLAIPTVLLAYVLRWIPGTIFAFFLNVFGAIVSAFAFLAPYVGWLVVVAVAVAVSVLLIRALKRTTAGRIILAFAAVALLSTMFFPEVLNTLMAAVLGVWSVASSIAAYPVAGLGYVFGFIGTVLTFVFSALLLLILSMFAVSQFGHIFIDSLFDARNVRRSARAAGRFLVGIGFLASTIVLCLPENQLAQRGVAQALVTASQLMGGDASYDEGARFASDLGSAYFLLIPNEVEPAIAKAFSYGYPPSLELILITIACIIALFLISEQIFKKENDDDFGIAFLPFELLFLLIGAVLVLLIAVAAANDAGG